VTDPKEQIVRKLNSVIELAIRARDEYIECDEKPSTYRNLYSITSRVCSLADTVRETSHASAHVLEERVKAARLKTERECVIPKMR
jgi:hypothetical protein